jgi:4-hydroxybenzoate polyprenyltransferase
LLAVLDSLRIHQWSKNFLLAVPPLLAQVWMEEAVAQAFVLAFVAFSLVASGNYLVNDLIDLEADRGDPIKRHRSLPSGRLPVRRAWLIGSGLIAAGIALAITTSSRSFAALLVAYLLIALAYSTVLKRILVLDVMVLAALYTLRLLAGGAATGVEVSSWLLAFSMFFFVSLAFAKRLAELNLTASDAARIRPRAYVPADREVFAAAGPASGLLSILVLALYVSSEVVRARYTHPDVLWMLCPLLLYWMLRVWFFALRGELDQDPLVFALRDRASYAVIAGVLLVLYFASR